MSSTRIAASFGLIFAVAFLTNAVVIYIWNAIFDSTPAFEWGTTFTIALVLAIVLTGMDGLQQRKKAR